MNTLWQPRCLRVAIKVVALLLSSSAWLKRRSATLPSETKKKPCYS
jgi:hypothetical protein